MLILKLEATTLFLDFEGGPIPDEVNLALAEEFKYETLEYVPGNRYNGGHAGYVKQSAYVYNKDKHCIPWGLFGDVKQFLEQNFPQYCPIRCYDTGHATTQGRVRPTSYNKTQYPVAVYKEPGIELETYQLEAVEAALTRRFGMVELPTGSGKCLGVDTPVLLFDGSVKKVQHVEVGDLLMGPDSKPREVLSVCCGQEMLYRVTPTKGDHYVVNESHILSLRMSPTGKDEIVTGGNGIRYTDNDIANINVRDYLASSKTFLHRAKGWRTGVYFPTREEEIVLPPYILGVWLGDGNNTNQGVCNVDHEVVTAYTEYCQSIGLTITINNSKPAPVYQGVIPSGQGLRGRGSKNSLLEMLKTHDLLHNKHIPMVYKTASRKDRLELLAGILDTDGYLSNGTYDIVIKEKQYAEDVCFVARSLGLAAYLTPVTKGIKATGFVGNYHRICISGNLDEIPCKVERRKAQLRKQVKDVTRTGIKVEPIGVGDYYGFEIDGDHLFLLGDFTVTHNTLTFLSIIEKLTPAVTLLAVSGTELIEQTYKQVVAMFPRATVKQWNCTASNKQKKEAVLWDPRDMTIIVCSYQTFNNYVGAPIVDAIDLVLMDEIQKITCDTFSPVVNKTPYAYSRIGFSATPFRDDNATMLVQGYCGPIIYSRPLRYMVDNGFLAQPIIKTANLFSVEGLCWLIEKALNNKIIVFHEQKVKGVEQSKAIFEEIAKELPEAWQLFATEFFASTFFVSSDKKSCRQELEEFKQCKAGCIFTTPLMDVGVDIPDANIAIFLQVNGKRKGAVVTPVQRIGRVLRVPKGQRGQAFLSDQNRKTGMCVIHHDPHKDGNQPSRTCNLYKTLTKGYFGEFDHGDPFLFPKP